ncbi:MAG: transglutaminase family protein, partial [Planctomycetales bacterium]|nr:transglutaminase family protein [Planctomycetales bacterium]
TDLRERVDAFGNHVHYFSIQEAHRALTLNAISEMEITPLDDPPPGAPWEDVRDSLNQRDRGQLAPPLLHRYSSALAPTSPEYAHYALKSFTPRRPIVDAMQDFSSRIHEDFQYDPVATTVTTPVRTVFEQRAGVCQDFAHVAIACLRSIGLAAEYVSGYLRTFPPPGKPRLVGADASHAWLSLYCGDLGWIDADPTNALLPRADHVTIAVGRDYADVCPIQGVYVGGGENTMTVAVDVAEVSEGGNP